MSIISRNSQAKTIETPEFKSEKEPAEIILHLKQENLNLVKNIKHLNKYVEYLNSRVSN